MRGLLLIDLFTSSTCTFYWHLVFSHHHGLSAAAIRYCLPALMHYCPTYFWCTKAEDTNTPPMYNILYATTPVLQYSFCPSVAALSTMTTSMIIFVQTDDRLKQKEWCLSLQYNPEDQHQIKTFDSQVSIEMLYSQVSIVTLNHNKLYYMMKSSSPTSNGEKPCRETWWKYGI